VQAVFTPRSVAGLEPMIAEHARQVVDELEARGGSEFVMDTASQLPLIVLCELMGVPHEERDRYFGWANAVANLEDPEVDDVGALAALVGYCHQMVDQKRQRPDGSMLSTYANATIEGRQLTANEIAAFFATLSIAGHETTRNTTAHFVRLMDAHPDQKAFLLEDLPGRLPNAVEEVLRCSPPVMDFRRTATCDVELHGVTIREGDKVYLSYVSANRDDEVFDDPDRFDILRPNAGDHLSFGTGPHLCLGAGLARMQLRVLLGELYRRLPDITVAAAPEWVPSVWFNALARMPVTTTAG
jgi:cytochrome P450